MTLVGVEGPDPVEVGACLGLPALPGPPTPSPLPPAPWPFVVVVVADVLTLGWFPKTNQILYLDFLSVAHVTTLIKL